MDLNRWRELGGFRAGRAGWWGQGVVVKAVVKVCMCARGVRPGQEVVIPAGCLCTIRGDTEQRVQGWRR